MICSQVKFEGLFWFLLFQRLSFVLKVIKGLTEKKKEKAK